MKTRLIVPIIFMYMLLFFAVSIAAIRISGHGANWWLLIGALLAFSFDITTRKVNRISKSRSDRKVLDDVKKFLESNRETGVR
jgi:hypothetical protein